MSLDSTSAIYRPLLKLSRLVCSHPTRDFGLELAAKEIVDDGLVAQDVVLPSLLRHIHIGTTSRVLTRHDKPVSHSPRARPGERESVRSLAIT